MNTITSRKGTRIQPTKRGYRYRAYKNGKAFYFPLPSYRDDALKLADEIRDHLKRHTLDQTRATYHPGYIKPVNTTIPYAAFKKFVRTKFRMAMGLSPVTATTYAGAYGRVIRHKLGREDIDDFNMFKFDAAWVEELKLDILGDANTPAEEVSKKRTFNAILRNLRAVVARDAEPVFAAQKWEFDWAGPLRELRPYKRVKKVWVSPDEPDIEEVHKFIEKQLSGDEYVVAALALYAGLRRKETAHASRSWVQRAGSEYRVWVVPKDQFVQKGTPGYTIIPKRILDEIEKRSLTHHDRYLKTNSDRLFRETNKRLREVLDVRHPLHELRRLFGTYVTNKYDLWTAQTYLRHDNAQTTFDSYAHGVMSKELLSLWE
jgi:integrase